MVDQEFQFQIGDPFSSPDDIYSNRKKRHVMKMYGREEKIRDFIEALDKEIQCINSHESTTKHEREMLDSETIRYKLLKISTEMLSFPSSEAGHNPIFKEITYLKHAYKNLMERVLSKLEKFLHSVKDLRAELRKSVKEFHDISRFTAHVTLVTSVTETALLVSHLLHRAFRFYWSPRLSILTTVVGCVSITTSLFALSYMKHSAAEIAKHVRGENRFFLDLIILHRKGNWIDEEVQKLFPHGIDLKLLGEKEMQNRNIFNNTTGWRQYLCSAIILTNIQKDVKLLKDKKFLQRVKCFVESQPAEIWWHRMKLKKLLDSMLKKMDAISSKAFIADHAIHSNRTALYLYSILIPWLLNSGNSTGLRVISTSIAAILAVSDLADNESVEFEELKKISQNFEKDLKEITEIYKALENDYD